MNTQQYTYLLANPQHVKKDDRSKLAAIIAAYPFFQSARALQLKALKNEESFLYNDALKVTAAHTTDRNILFNYITSKSFEQHEISQAIIKHDATVDNMTVVAEDISEQVSIAIDNEIKAELKKADAILNPELFQKKVADIERLVEETSEKKEVSQTTPEETLGLDKPLEFTKKDTHSFTEWLQLSKATPINRAEDNDTIKEPKEDDELAKEKNFELIEKFIEKGAKLLPQQKANDASRQKTEKINLAEPFTQSPDTLMTETLAKVYMQQKKYKKAIQAYNILILKNPEKSGFFADQIRAIKNLINTEEK